MSTVPKVELHLTKAQLGFTSNTKWTANGFNRHALIVSQSHRKSDPDNGGTFYVQHDSKEFMPSGSTFTASEGSLQTQSVQFVPNALNPFTTPSIPANGSWTSEKSLLQSHGSTGYRRARPGNPVANAGQWVAELRDLPTLPLRQALKLRNFASLGSEYLNVEFGWKPFVKDLQKMVETYQRMDKLITQLKRDNGKAIRRRRTISETTDTTSTITQFPTSFGAFLPAPVAYSGSSASSTLTYQKVTTERIWFVGRFRYYIPDIESSQWTRRAQTALFGANPTPSLLWEVMPWTWLVGYFSNVGDVISNMSSNAVDNLVTDYAYVMRTKKVRETYTAVGTFRGVNSSFKNSSGTYSATSSQTTESKSRSASTPYGFGVSFGSLSGYQTGILAALGISRSRF